MSAPPQPCHEVNPSDEAAFWSRLWRMWSRLIPMRDSVSLAQPTASGDWSEARGRQSRVCRHLLSLSALDEFGLQRVTIRAMLRRGM